MKKIAILIGAYQNAEYLQYLLDSFDSESTNIYIHINKKNKGEFESFFKRNQYRKNVFLFSEYKKYKSHIIFP